MANLATPACISNCRVDHTRQPADLRECTATDQIGAVRSTVAGLSPAYIAVNRWRDPDGPGAEVVIYPPQRDGEPDPDPLTFTPVHAQDLAQLLLRAAEKAGQR
jgi:hypothetical protein